MRILLLSTYFRPDVASTGVILHKQKAIYAKHLTNTSRR